MTTGIIYLAKNKINNKGYVGQTTRTLEQRIKEHYYKTTKYNHKFANALKKYSKEDWNWSVLQFNIPIEELNTYELNFITELNTFNEGYNSALQGYCFEANKLNPSYNATIYELWHPEHGVVKGTISQLVQRSRAFTRLSQLIKGKANHIKGFVLLSNKDKYKAHYSNLKLNKHSILTMQHKDCGVITATLCDFINQYNLTYAAIANVKANRIKSTKGWQLIDYII